MKGMRHHASFSFLLFMSMLLLMGCKGKTKGESSRQDLAKGGPSKPVAGTGTSKVSPAASAPQWTLLPLGYPTPRLLPDKAANSLYIKANKAFKKNDAATVMANLDEALMKDPFFDEALWLRAHQYIQDGKTQEALGVLERIAALNVKSFVSTIEKTAWLKPLTDQDAWKPFEEKLQAYAKKWGETLRGPGVFFLQGKFRKVEMTDQSGEPVDLTLARGVLRFWSKGERRFMDVGSSDDVAGFLYDRSAGRIILVHWYPHEADKPGAFGRVTISKADLGSMKADTKPITVAEEAQAVRVAIDSKGNVLVSVVPPGVAEENPSEEVGPGEKESEDLEEEKTEEEGGAAEESVGEEEGEGEETAPAAGNVMLVDWDSGKLIETEAGQDITWPLVVAFGKTTGPAPLSAPGVDAAPPKAKRGGACVWVDAASVVCIEPTKKGGRFNTIELREEGKDPVRLDENYVPVIQY